MSQKPELRINCASETATIGALVLPCRIGKGGFIDGAEGREGDAKTPLGLYHLRWGFYRADKLPAPPCHSKNPLTWRATDKRDGWSDAETDPAYNRFIRLPHSASHEALWREDGAYDIVLIMSHNDSPPTGGLGSAVFLHIAQPDDRRTLGCIAFAPEDITRLLPHLQQDMAVRLYE